MTIMDETEQTQLYIPNAASCKYISSITTTALDTDESYSSGSSSSSSSSPSSSSVVAMSPSAAANVRPASILDHCPRHDIKFEAAAAAQVPELEDEADLPSSTGSHPEFANFDVSGQDHLLVASPYLDEDHLLDLTTLSLPCRLLAKALTVMTNTTPEYAIAPYKSAFNWDHVVSTLQKLSTELTFDEQSVSGSAARYILPRSEFYIIVFRSRLPPGADRRRLGALDKAAHREAVVSGQLLKYWFGTPHAETGRNLATCVWRNREDAKKGGAGPGHLAAMRAVMGIYLEWTVERLKFVVNEGATSWSIDKWED